MVFEVQCGKYHFRRVDAETPGEAWRKSTDSLSPSIREGGFAPLARFREKFPKVGRWHYITPQAFDGLE